MSQDVTEPFLRQCFKLRRYDPQFHAESQGRGESLRGSVGDGPRIAIVTSRGSITVRQASVGDEAVTFPGIPTAPEASKSP